MKKKNIIISLAIVLCVVVALTGVLAACNDTVNDNMFSAGKLAVQKDGLWGYMDSSGEMVIDAQYDTATPFCGNYAVVTLGDKVMLIDGEGNEFMELSGVGIVASEDGTRLAVSEKNTALMGVLDTGSGEWVVRPMYDEIYFTKGGQIIVRMGACYGMLAADGTQLYPVEYEYASGDNAVALYKSTEDGVELVLIDPSTGAETEKLTRTGVTVGVLQGSKSVLYYGYMDENGNNIRVVPGNENAYDSSTSYVTAAYDNVLFVEKRTEGAATGTYELQKTDGTAIAEGTYTGNIYDEDTNTLVLTVDGGENGTSYLLVDTLAAAVQTYDGTGFVRALDGSLWLANADGTSLKQFGEGGGEIALDLPSGARLEQLVSASAYTTYNAGVYTLVKDGADAVVLPLGTRKAIVDPEGKYLLAYSKEGYWAAYKTDGTSVFGYDAEITLVMPASI